MIFTSIFENLKISADSVRVNKMRSLLASLGVVIGISFVLIMGWILTGLDAALDDTFNILGSDMFYVDKWDWAGGKNWKEMKARKNITQAQANEFCKRIKSAEFAVPTIDRFGSVIKIGNQSIESIPVEGTKSDFALTPGGTVIEGRFFSKTEEHYGARMAVIGYGINTLLFPNGDAIGKNIKINGQKYLIIGVVKKQATMLLDFIDKKIYIPITSFSNTFGSTKRSFSIAVKAGSKENMQEVRAEIEGVMRQVRNLHPNQEMDFSINETKAFEATFATIRSVIWLVGIGMTGLSFLVGMIGIMNIMFVSVAERTKEIGIRKAIGATKFNIMLQFLFESSMLCLLGAFISFVLCSAIVYAVATGVPMLYPSITFLSPILPMNLLIIASIVSLLVGVLAGLIPAMRAANLNPVDALRFE